MPKQAFVKGIQSYLPPQKLTNDQLALEFPHHDIDKAFQNTGVSQRSIAGEYECASDLGVEASKKLFNSGLCNPEEIDFLIFCTQTPDHFLPSSASIIHERLGLKTSCGALDIYLGCSGFVYGLGIAKTLIESSQVENVLLINSDVLSKVIHPGDFSTRFLFSDAATATLISVIDLEEELIGPFVFGTDGKGANNLIIPAGGMRLRPNDETAKVNNKNGSGNLRSAQNIFMDGAEIFNFFLKTVPTAVHQLLEKAQITFDAVDFIIFHQANRFLLESLRRKIKIPKEKFPIMLDLFGNTSSATIPITLEEVFYNNNIQNIMVVGFGVGYSWAASLLGIRSKGK